MEERMNADRKTDQEKMAADKEDLLAKIKEEMIANQEELLAKMDLMMVTWNTHTETKKIEQDPEMMQSVEEHQDIPTEDVAVMPVRELRKWRRVWKLAAERRQKPKKRTGGCCRSRKRVKVACRKKVSRHATVARRKRNVFGKIWTEVNCGPWSALAATGRRMTCHAKVA
jgi:hypothetical protein